MEAATDFRIRLAEREDIPTILTLIRELAEYERAPNEVIATEDQLRENLFGAHPAAEVLIGEEAGEPVGFALFFHNFSTWMGRRGLYLEDLFVRPAVRGRGYGRALLVRLAELARERNCGRMEWAVLDWNKPAIQFYLKLGARPNEEWTIYRLTREGIGRLAECP
ncbi:MAG: GNAT family N-acetyltransferase [Chthoniobacterales bacterium]